MTLDGAPISSRPDPDRACSHRTLKARAEFREGSVQGGTPSGRAFPDVKDERRDIRLGRQKKTIRLPLASYRNIPGLAPVRRRLEAALRERRASLRGCWFCTGVTCSSIGARA